MFFLLGALHSNGCCHIHKKQVAQEAVRAASAGGGACGGARAHWLACTESEGRSIEGDRGYVGVPWNIVGYIEDAGPYGEQKDLNK